VHEAATTAIKFIDSKLLLTASVDSTINLLRTKDWAVLRTLKGHKGRVNDVDLHPKGRIALSVGQDRTLRFWDIVGNTNSVTGKGGSSSTKLGQGQLCPVALNSLLTIGEQKATSCGGTQTAACSVSSAHARCASTRP
jgi:WD40 repeat protein